MALVTAEKLNKRFDDQVALSDVSLMINPGDRVALVGRNGIGKTTLLNIIAGLSRADSGQLHRSKGLRIDFVRQELDEFSDLTLRSFVLQARDDLLELGAALGQCEQHLASAPEDEALLARYDEMQREFERQGGFEFENEVEITLGALGFPIERWESPLATFSGGEANRASLARALVGSGDLLLLDEPTNHLDIVSTEWLEKTLTDTRRAYVIVSHDRMFLGNLINKVWELSFGSLDVYHNGFEKYLTESLERRSQRQKEFERQREFIEKTEAFIRKNLAGQKTKQAQSRRTQLAKLKRLDSPKGASDAPHMNISASGRSYQHVLSVEGLTIGYDGDPILRDISFDLYRGDKVALIGANGSGKSTLIKTLLGEVAALEGEARIGSAVDIGYFNQSLSDLDDELTPLEHLWRIDTLADQGTLRSYLARFGFFSDDTFKIVGKLSGGEKTKLSLACLMYQPTNFLIFDEPTNHLDVESREALETALADYNGACLIVSHDRYFLDRATSKTLAIEDGALSTYPGSYSYYAEKRLERQRAAVTTDSGGKDEYRSFKERSKRKTALEKKIKSVGSQIADHERKLHELESLITNDIPKNDWEKLSETSAEKSDIELTLLELYQGLEDHKEELARFIEDENIAGEE